MDQIGCAIEPAVADDAATVLTGHGPFALGWSFAAVCW